MNGDDELKSCPFCGGKAELRDMGSGTGGHYVNCWSCGVLQFGTPIPHQLFNDRVGAHEFTREKAIEKWNARIICPLAISDYEETLADQKRLVREIDVIMNGEAAAPQAGLCDLVGQIKELVHRAAMQPAAVNDIKLEGLIIEIVDIWAQTDDANSAIWEIAEKLRPYLRNTPDIDEPATVEQIQSLTGLVRRINSKTAPDIDAVESDIKQFFSESSTRKIMQILRKH